jgi:hypothetical protein
MEQVSKVVEWHGEVDVLIYLRGHQIGILVEIEAERTPNI